MEFLTGAIGSLLSPPILFFALGILAAALRSDLEIPSAVGKALALYLVLAIGFKGGVALSEYALGAEVFLVVVAALVLSVLLPVIAYALARRFTRLSAPNAAAAAAAYGSVSLVTFVTAAAFLESRDLAYGGYLVAILALMESPAIIVGLFLARRRASLETRHGSVFREAFLSGSVVLLVGSLIIGLATGTRGSEMLAPFVIAPFQGVLAVFLLDMGLLVVRRLRESKDLDWRVIAFGLYVPLIGATLALLAAWLIGLGVADGTLLIVLGASASYIAVPAAMRHALPDASPGVYLTLSLGVTFPFNIIVGIPAYFAAAGFMLS